MPFNGSGAFSPLPAPDYPAVAGEIIYASRFNNVVNDLLAGLTNTITKDGQSTPTANLPMGGFRLTGAGGGNTSGMPLIYGQTENATLGGNLTLTGALLANGGVTLGDGSGDALTITSAAVTLPNGLNFDANTLVIDAANNRVGFGTNVPAVTVDIMGIAQASEVLVRNNGSVGSIGTTPGLYSPASGQFAISWNGAERLRGNSVVLVEKVDELKLQGSNPFRSWYDASGITRYGYLQFPTSTGTAAGLITERAQALVFGVNNVVRQSIAADDGGVSFTGALRATASSTFTAGGAGVEVQYVAGVAYLQGYDRTAAAYRPVDVVGSTVTLEIGGAGAALEIDASRRMLNTAHTQPSFYARRTTEQTSGTTYIFDVEDHDYGSWYASGTGIAVAPVAGVYQINFTGFITNTSGGSVSVSITLYKNLLGVQVALATQGSLVTTGTSGCYSASVCVALAAADTIQVVGNTLTASLTWGGCSFSARLLG